MSIRDVAPPLATWKSYDYFPGGHVYRDVVHDPGGGPGGSPCVWADDSLWSVDTPEQPHSILFFINYRYWNNEPPIDLGEAEVIFSLRGEDLDPREFICTFWVVTYAPKATRWHLTSRPIPVSAGSWGEPVRLQLPADGAGWHRSFAARPEQASTLEQTLRLCYSYGFAFTGFARKVTGRVGLADFQLFARHDPAWPFIFDGRNGSLAWQTVSRTSHAQLAVLDPGRRESRLTETSGRHGPGLYLQAGDFLLLGEPFRFCYLAFVRGREATAGRDLRGAMVMVRQSAEGFDSRGGKVCFFVEHSASGTRWVLKVPIENRDNRPWSAVLTGDDRFWGRLTGSASLSDVLAGTTGGAGYDYFGIMLVGPGAQPAGLWGLTCCTVGPTLPPECIAAPVMREEGADAGLAQDSSCRDSGTAPR
ncbi:MAG: hypothetical protein AB1568_11745 [Thermodesulfobacteriota bacterium]